MPLITENSGELFGLTKIDMSGLYCLLMAGPESKVVLVSVFVASFEFDTNNAILVSQSFSKLKYFILKTEIVI